MARQRLGNAYGREFHEYIHHFLLFREACNLVDIVVGEQRIALPVAVVEAQRDVVAERNITQKKLKVGRKRTVLNIVRRLPTQYMSCTFGEHALESHLCSLVTNVITVNKR